MAVNNDNEVIVSRYVGSTYAFKHNGQSSSFAVWDQIDKQWVVGPVYATRSEADGAAAALIEAGSVDHGSRPSDDVEPYLPGK